VNGKSPVRALEIIVSVSHMCGGAAISKKLSIGRRSPVDWSQLFAQCRIQAVHLSHGAIVGRNSRNDVNLVGIVFNAVKNRFGKRVAVSTALVVPAVWLRLKAEVGWHTWPEPLNIMVWRSRQSGALHHNIQKFPLMLPTFYRLSLIVVYYYMYIYNIK